MEKENKTRKILTIVLLVIAITLVIGVSYAAWRYTFTGNANTINTPSIELELLESTDEIINITNALPMSDTNGKEQSTTFNFAVTTKTSAAQDIGYSLKIEKISVDSGYTALSDNQIKVYLTDYNNTELVGPTLINDLNNYVLYGKKNSHNSTTTQIQDKYKLRAWIDWEVDASNWTQNTKLQYKFKIGVTEKQEQTSNTYAVYSWSTSGVSIGAPLDSISGYTTDYATLGYDYFLKHNIGSDNTVESQEVCYILNSEVYCLMGYDTSYYEENTTTLFASFGEDSCSVYSSYVNCSSSGVNANAYSGGYVYASDGGFNCDVIADGSARCDTYSGGGSLD